MIADANPPLQTTEADDARRKLVPYLDTMHRTMLDLLPDPQPGETLRILDLGPGSGLLADRLLKSRDDCTLTVIDLSEPAIADLRERLAPFGDRVSFKTGDYVHMTYDGPYDAVVAELSVHHATGKSMRTLFSASYAALRRGGIFIDADQVRGDSDAIETLMIDAWRRDAGRAGAAKGDIEAAVALHRENRPPTLERILQSLSDDGFENVSCIHKEWGFAVFCGMKL